MKPQITIPLTVATFIVFSNCQPTASDKEIVHNNKIPLYQGVPLRTWQIEINNDQQTQVITGANSQLPDQTVLAKSINKNTQNDALQLTFNDTWYASMSFTGGEPLDLSQFMSTGVVSFDIRLDDIKNAALDLKMSCGKNCEASVRLREWALEQDPTKWHHLAIPLNCFTQKGGEFSAVNQPFTLVTGNQGKLSIGNIEIIQTGVANFSCQDLSQISTTPATLNESWSVDWWLPRHKEKLAKRSQEVELLMIGDSITHGWEDKGKTVWDKEFSDINTINLGFGGDRTENVLWRLEHGAIDNIAPKLAVIMIGTNNTGHRLDPPEEIYQGIDAIVEKIQQKLPKTKIVIFSIFPRSAQANDKLRINNNQSNQLLGKLKDKYPLEVLNINQDFLDAKGNLSTEIMPDLLHPNEQGYQIWANKLKPVFAKYITAE
ncbi:MAG: putative glycoside hydrolase [Paraglaciecola sp.]|uniref:putative glycoside hydrolase n=1 Tax=Paraglaciecola sp. TaxID=1920173 RepID=UPI0032985388